MSFLIEITFQREVRCKTRAICCLKVIYCKQTLGKNPMFIKCILTVRAKVYFSSAKKPHSLLRGSFNQQLKGVKCFALKTALPSSKKDEARRQKLRCQLRLKYFSISEFFVCIQFALHVYTSIITPYRCCRMSYRYICTCTLVIMHSPYI